LKYYELLNKIIEESKLTHKEIAEKCVNYDITINPSYISKLKTGKQPPASDDVNKAIAKACNSSDQIDNLLYLAFLEKAPNYIKDFLNGVIAQFKLATKLNLKKNIPEEFASVVEQQINQLTDIEIIKKSTEEINKLGIGNKEDSNNIEPIWTMNDNSMEPLIPQGALIHLDRYSEVLNGDIAAIKINGDNLIRKYFRFEEKVFLVSINSEVHPIITDIDSIDLMGKASFFTRRL